MTFCHISSRRKIREISLIFYRSLAGSLRPIDFARICLQIRSHWLGRSSGGSPAFIRAYLEALVKRLKARNVHVFTRIYETVLDAPRQVPLMHEFNATPNFAFWPPYLAARPRDIDRWSALVRATERHSMKWEERWDGM